MSRSLIVRPDGGVESRVEALRMEHPDDQVLSSIQSNLIEGTESARSLPFLGGTLFLNLSFTSGVTKVIPHRLGRRVLEVFVCPPTGAVARFRRVAQSPAALDDVQVALVADATTTASCFIY